MMYAEGLCVWVTGWLGGVYMDTAGAIKSGHHWKYMAKRDSLCNVYWELNVDMHVSVNV